MMNRLSMVLPFLLAVQGVSGVDAIVDARPTLAPLPTVGDSVSGVAGQLGDQGARVRVTQRDVMAVLREHFPNRVAREGAEGIRSSPALSGSARGRLAEHVWGRSHSGAEHGGFRPTANPNAPQNDFWSSQLQRGSQVKTHRHVSSYLDSMRSDHLAELFVVPDDQVEAVRRLWKAEHRVAIARGDHAAAREALRQVNRVRPLGRSMAWLDARLGTATPLTKSTSIVATTAAGSGLANAALGAGVVVVLGGIDAAVALSRYHDGELSGAQLNDELLRAGAQTVSAAALGAVLLALPEAPFLVVIAAGVATAYATDALVDEYLASASLDPSTQAVVFRQASPLVVGTPREQTQLSGLITDSALIHESGPWQLDALLDRRRPHGGPRAVTLTASKH